MDDKLTQGLFTERDLTLVENCQAYADGNPGGLPGHALMLVVAKLARLVNHMATLLTPEEIEGCMVFLMGSPPPGGEEEREFGLLVPRGHKTYADAVEPPA